MVIYIAINSYIANSYSGANVQELIHMTHGRTSHSPRGYRPEHAFSAGCPPVRNVPKMILFRQRADRPGTCTGMAYMCYASKERPRFSNAVTPSRWGVILTPNTLIDKTLILEAWPRRDSGIARWCNPLAKPGSAETGTSSQARNIVKCTESPGCIPTWGGR